MNFPAKLVVYPARGLLGSTKVVDVVGELQAIRALGATDAARFDLAVEVPARRFRGVHAPQFFVNDIPALFSASWAVVSAVTREVAA